ncbi:MAG: flagellar hook-basal body protein [Synergistaceae bacterium]|jgi:flagellar basal-body rod protein FlgG|nr:flagellar hook-basal body protein [Synergistaceae bacterium]
MFRGIYAGMSAMLVQEKMLDVVGNNLANVDTAGFRGRVAVNKSFPEVLVDRVERYTVVDEALNEELGNRKFFPYVKGRTSIGTMSITNVLSETTMSTDPGSVQFTDNPLDVMINGEGFFVVEDGNGNTFYTRAGNFQKGPAGELMTHEGEFVLGNGGRIALGEAVSFFVGENGQVYADNEAVDQLQVVVFENPTYLHQEGKSLLSETPESGEPQAVEAPAVVGGALERSNVQIVLEMVRMIEANRAYEAAGRAITIQDELSGRLYTSVGRPT